MSLSKKDRNFPGGNGLSSDAQLAEIIAGALRQDFGDTPSSIKQIGRLTKAHLRAIKNWYIAKNAPSSRYLLILARSSPSILRFILMQIGGEDLWDVFDLSQRQVLKGPVKYDLPVAEVTDNQNVTTTVISRSPKERRKWFIEQLSTGHKVTAEDLMARWNVNLRTARRDISDLVAAGLILFRGGRRNGFYELVVSRKKEQFVLEFE
ncbi:DeoR family transcriptional regulator [Asticcacaulis sp.]|uniref:DeoR family transcriptional regulator n=1 Tax=Asticcacaulis sp. TaxID=1872648 RepID=UPI003F7B44A5